MKVVIFFAIIAVTLAIELDVKFFEKHAYYNQKVKVNPKTVEFSVPKHEGLDQADYLYDYEARMVVLKIPVFKKCYAYDMPKEDKDPMQILTGITNMKEKFPESRYMVTNKKMLPLHKLGGNLLTSTIKSFCGQYPVIKVAIFGEQKQLEEAAVAHAKANKDLYSSNRSKRDLSFEEFTPCNRRSASYIPKCINSGKTLQTKCKLIRRGVCVFTAICNSNDIVWTCPDPNHIYHGVHCCDYFC